MQLDTVESLGTWTLLSLHLSKYLLSFVLGFVCLAQAGTYVENEIDDGGVIRATGDERTAREITMLLV